MSQKKVKNMAKIVQMSQIIVQISKKHSSNDRKNISTEMFK